MPYDDIEFLLRNVDMAECMALDCRQNTQFCGTNAESLIGEGIKMIKQIQVERSISKQDLEFSPELKRYRHIITKYL